MTKVIKSKIDGVTADAINQRKLGEQLKSAARDGDLDVINKVIDSGLDVNYLGPFGVWSPPLRSLLLKFFDYESDRNELIRLLDCLERLLEAGADPNLGSPTPFELAVGLRNRKVLKLLIDFGADVNAVREGYKVSPLHMVLAPEEDEFPVDDGCAIDLISAGANLMVKDGVGRLPIHYASGFGFVLVLQEILNRRPEGVNAIDDDGVSPIMLAAVNGHENIVKLLESYGAEAPDDLISILETAVLEKNKLEKVRIDDRLQSLDVSGDDDVYLTGR